VFLGANLHRSARRKSACASGQRAVDRRFWQAPTPMFGLNPFLTIGASTAHKPTPHQQRATECAARIVSSSIRAVSFHADERLGTGKAKSVNPLQPRAQSEHADSIKDSI